MTEECCGLRCFDRACRAVECAQRRVRSAQVLVLVEMLRQSVIEHRDSLPWDVQRTIEELSEATKGDAP